MNSIDTTLKSNDYGKWLSQPPPGEEILITGISGAYPESRNLFEFRDNLYNKIDMITIDDRRWSITHPEIPAHSGKLPNVEKFDPGFFGIHRRQADAMDPMVRILLQKAIEAVMDAGLNPKELENTNTGVFMGSTFSESEPPWFNKQFQKQHFAFTGCARSMISHRISYFLKLKGPSHNIDTACSSSLYALEQAYKSIRNGTCDMAIVGGINLCLHPYVTLQFSRIGVLSRDGKCKVFDRDSNGYVRSEAATVIILQKSKEAKRNYCRVIHAKTNCDGFKQQGITFPSREVQQQLLSDVYNESGVKPEELSYLEAHGTGTLVGDPEEAASIDLILCKNRSKTLLVGSVKSNVGHSEPSSGLSSIAKAILSMENGVIPPNLHYYNPREGVEALKSGRLHVVTENTEFQDDRGLIGINNLGFGGANAHVILQWNDKNKSTDPDNHYRLVCVSGRTPQTVDKILNYLKNAKYNPELIRLYHGIFKTNIPGNYFRGFTILSEHGELQRIESSHFNPRSPKLCLIIGEFSTNSIMDLSKIPICQELFHKYEHILSSQQFAAFNSDKSHTDQTMSGVLTQLALIEIFKAIKLTPDFRLGCGYGEIICAYLDGSLTLEQTLKSSLLRAKNEQEDIHDFTKMIQNERISKKEEPLNGKEADEKLMQTQLDGVMDIPKKTKKWLIHCSEGNISQRLLKTVRNKTFKSRTLKTFKRDTMVVTLGDISTVLGEDFSVLHLENGTKNIFQDLLGILGRLYLSGFDLQLDKLYPEVSFPVSRGTPMISPLIEWNQNDYFVTYYRPIETSEKSSEEVFEINLRDEKWSFLTGHVIDGRNLFPATGYLIIIWETFASSLGRVKEDMDLVFENCCFHRATNLTKDKHLGLTITLYKRNGQFEVKESKTLVVSGRIYISHCKGNEEILFPETNAEYSLDTKDVYKELRLRGYNYSGGFKNIIACNEEITEGLIRWDDNWTTFTDNMLQLKVLQIDTRNLYVPLYIKRLSIDAKRHIALVRSTDDEQLVFPVMLHKNIDSIRCGGIELQGLKAASISRKKLNLEPVLERYVFVPNDTEITLRGSIRICLQIILENNLGLNKITIGEISSDDNLGTRFEETLLDFPIITSNGTSSIEKPQEANYSDFDLVIGNNILQKPELLTKILKEIKKNSYVLSRELDLGSSPPNINILTVHETNEESMVMFKKKIAEPNLTAVNISDCNEFTWLKNVQNLVNKHKNVILYSQSQPTNGILGLINCLRKEPGLDNVRCVLIQSEAPDFDPILEFYRKQLAKNMAINIYQDGTWGTYRHLLIEDFPKVSSQHCYVNNLIKGDLSSIDWVEGPLSEYINPAKELVYVYYSSLNFRDVMVASGKINSDVITMNRNKQECIQGLEFVGRTSNGKRVMGMIEAGAMATMLEANRDFLWPIPDEWSLEEAATVPVVYATLIYAFFMRSELKARKSILIHSGTGGIGLAAINLALHEGCSVFTTVGSLEKKEFLRKMFPQIPETHIGNSRNTTFEQMIYHQTKGRGVDFVLNSLSEDKLQASIRCLAVSGTFLEIGKFDLAKDSPLQLMFLEKQASFLGVMLDRFFTVSSEVCSEFKKELDLKLFTKIRQGAVKPLPRTVFSDDEVVNAYKYMTTGKHMGKVLVKIRDEESGGITPPQIKIMNGRARYIANPKYSYVGIVAEMQHDGEKQIGGTLPQPIHSCLNVLEPFLRQRDSVIVSSIVLGQKRSALLGDDLVQVVAQILGIKDMKTISLHAPLSELGMDSMTAQEIQQTLEREFQVFLGLQDIRNITFAGIQNLQNDLKGDHQAPPLMTNLIRHLADSDEIAFKYVELKTKMQKDSTDVIMFPGIEGTAQCFTQLANELQMTAVSLQYSYDEDNSTVDRVAHYVISTIERFLSESKTFFFIAYSYGVIVALQSVQILEQKGFVGTLICIDGAPELFSEMMRNTEDVETQIVCRFLAFCISSENVAKNKADIKKAINIHEKLNVGEELLRQHTSYSRKHFRKLADIVYQRICSLKKLSALRKIKSKIILFKPTNGILSLKAEDYGLSKHCEGPVDVKVYDGNHVTILNSLALAEDLNNIYGKEIPPFCRRS